MNKMVEQAKRMLEENGVNPDMLEETIKYARTIEALESELCVTVDKTSKYIKSLEQEKENLEEEVSYLERAVDDYRDSGLRLMDEDIELLDELINVNLESKDVVEQIKSVQDKASRRLSVLEIIRLYSR